MRVGAHAPALCSFALVDIGILRWPVHWLDERQRIQYKGRAPTHSEGLPTMNADGITYDAPVYSVYTDWTHARAALVAFLPPRPTQKGAIRVVQLIQKKAESLSVRPSPAQIAHWHDHDNLDLAEITSKLEDRKAEFEVWNWVAVVILQNISTRNDRQAPRPQHPRGLQVCAKIFTELRALLYAPAP